MFRDLPYHYRAIGPGAFAKTQFIIQMSLANNCTSLIAGTIVVNLNLVSAGVQCITNNLTEHSGTHLDGVAIAQRLIEVKGDGVAAHDHVTAVKSEAVRVDAEYTFSLKAIRR